MKLISMTDYVDKVLTEWTDRAVSEIDLVARLSDYKDFLKTPLTLGMFVPCDEEGNVLEEPISSDPNSLSDPYFMKDLEDYQKAKERVIFEGFDMEMIEQSGILIVIKQGKTVEQYIPMELTLTESKAKELGL